MNIHLYTPMSLKSIFYLLYPTQSLAIVIIHVLLRITRRFLHDHVEFTEHRWKRMLLFVKRASTYLCQSGHVTARCDNKITRWWRKACYFFRRRDGTHIRRTPVSKSHAVIGGEPCKTPVCQSRHVTARCDNRITCCWRGAHHFFRHQDAIHTGRTLVAKSHAVIGGEPCKASVCQSCHVTAMQVTD